MTFSYSNTQHSLKGGKKMTKKLLLKMVKDIKVFVHIRMVKNVTIKENIYLIVKFN